MSGPGGRRQGAGNGQVASAPVGELPAEDEPGSYVAVRPLRADAVRNRERLLDSARTVFAEQGAEASMEAIAKNAGVGVGTLYRHFPRRVDVVEALFRSDMDVLVEEADKASGEPDAWLALVGFLKAYVRYLMAKKTLLGELHDAFAKNPELKLASRERARRALDGVLRRAQEQGLARADLDSEDVMQLLGPMCMSATLTEPQAERLTATVLDGLRYRQP
ncbi:MAG TPA: helix-turn-helix domain-containing protein [Acidimicrobiales bacterium]|nr:helix-turn-helix domain-containing protein [Acidimicrobiales bacterium]